MHFYVIVELSEDKLGISPITAAFLSGFEVRWVRDGETRIIPDHLIEDAHRLAVTEWAHSQIEWDQCKALSEKSRPVTLNPRPARS